jgi:small GTP-binding protein
MALLSSIADKVILLGDVGVGKTSIFSRFKTGQMEYEGREAEHNKSWTVNGQSVTMTLFDTAGMERHMGTIPHTYFHSAKALLLVYSMDDEETFDSLASWIENAMSARSSSSSEELLIGLVGNKLDLEKRVDGMRAKQLAEWNEIPSDMIFEISALEETNLQGMFDAVALKIKPQAGETAKANKMKEEGSSSQGRRKCC